MEFLYEDELDQAIKAILGEDECCAAVAFWGKGASDLLKKKNRGAKAKIICNLMSGGTNPYEVEKLMKIAHVKQLNDLHAKVYIGRDSSIVASANVSGNGLGLEGLEQNRWREAGLKSKDLGFNHEVQQLARAPHCRGVRSVFGIRGTFVAGCSTCSQSF